MARGRKTGGRDWKPGESGNLKGCPPLPADVKQARQLNRFELEKVLNKFIYFSKDDLDQVILNPDAPIIEVFLAKMLLLGSNEGDFRRLQFLLDRLVGKVPDKVELKSKYEIDAEKMSNAELMEHVKEAMSFLNKDKDD